MTTIDEVESSLRNTGIAYSERGSGKLSACGCVVSVDPFGKTQIWPESPDADPDRIQMALTYH